MNSRRCRRAEFDELLPAHLMCAMHPGRTRHHQILDIIRARLAGTFRSQPRIFRSGRGLFRRAALAALNFLPVPEDVGVPRAPCRSNFNFGRAN